MRSAIAVVRGLFWVWEFQVVLGPGALRRAHVMLGLLVEVGG